MRNLGSGAFGGFDTIGGVVEVEETALQAVVRGLRRWYESKGVQRKFGRVWASQALPGAAVVSWEGKPRVVVMPWEAFSQLCQSQGQGNGYALKRELQKVRASVDWLEKQL